MTPDYATFLATKAPKAAPVGIEPAPMPAHLKPFQADSVAFAIRQGRAALFHDTGLGKSRQQLEWCKQCADASNGYALILTPLAVTRQFEREGLALGYDCRVVRDQSEVRPGVNICNYDRLDKLDLATFGAASLDEASVLKNFTGKLTRALIDGFANTRFKLLATATPAPNDHMELGQSAEFLGVMPSNEMLMRWFIADQTQMGKYRLKRHGEHAFWDWMASWARMARTPSDLGDSDDGYVLPELKIIRHRAVGDIRAPAGALFMTDVSATNMHDVKRQTAGARADVVADLVAAEPDEQWLVWCDTDYEADALTERMPFAREVRGSQATAKKEDGITAFVDGSVRVLITKPKICQFGLNFQHAARMVFVGRSFSYEAFYQCVRREWRFGQLRPVHAHLIVAEGEDQIGRVIDRKATDHVKMQEAMAAAMRRARGVSSERKVEYDPRHTMELPSWLASAA